MMTRPSLLGVSLAAALAACLVASPAALSAQAAAAPVRADDPETVLATFHVKAGQLPAFLQLMADYGKALREQNLITSQPYVLMQGEEDGKPIVIQLFTWRSHEIPDHVPVTIKPFWDRMNTMVEARNGHAAIEFPEMTLIPG